MYDDFLKQSQGKNKKTCFITEIRDVERCSYEAYCKLRDSIQPQKSFVLCSEVEVEKNKYNCESYETLYLYDNNGNSRYINEIQQYLYEENGLLELVVIDASAINKETLLELFFVMRNIVNVKATIQIIYTTPSDYGDYDYDNYKVPYSLSFSPGKQLMGNKSALILISGYEANGELALIRHIDPEYLFVGLAEPSTEEPFKVQNVVNINKIIKEFSKDQGIKIEEFKCAGNDVEKCYADIKKLLEDKNIANNCNVFIAPMNNKLTTVASYLVWEKYTDIQMIDIVGERRRGSVKESGRRHIYKFEIREAE
jgi:hypothetical protein